MSPWQSGRRCPRFLSFFMTQPKPQLATRLTLSGDLRRLQWAMFIVTMVTLTLGRRSQVSGIPECQQLYSQCSFPGSRGRYSTCVVSVVDTLYVLGNHDTNTFYALCNECYLVCRRSNKPERIREHQSADCGEANCGPGPSLGAAAGPSEKEASHIYTMKHAFYL